MKGQNMLRLIGVITLCVSLGGCFWDFQNPIQLNTQYDIEAAYLTAENIAVIYIESCRTKVIQRSVCGPVVSVIQTKGRKAQAAILALRAFTKQHPTLNPITALNAAQSAIADFQFALSKTQRM